MTPELWFYIEVALFTVILIPTVVALVTGAPWVPTPMVRVRKMLELAHIKAGDRVYDLGCGDGRMVHLAAKEYGADAIGLELSPLIYAMARVRNFLVRSRSKVLFRDFRRIDYRNTKAIVCYLLPEVLKVMQPKLEKELPPGARFVSYAFQVAGWTPVYVEPKDPARNLAPIYVYEMPASTAKRGELTQ